MPKCDSNKVVENKIRHGCSSVNLLHIFRTPFDKNTWKELLMDRPNVKTLALTEGIEICQSHRIMAK